MYTEGIRVLTKEVVVQSIEKQVFDKNHIRKEEVLIRVVGGFKPGRKQGQIGRPRRIKTRGRNWNTGNRLVNSVRHMNVHSLS